MLLQQQRLVSAHTSTTCCSDYVGNTAAAYITYMNKPHSIHDYPVADLYIHVELGKVKGF